MKLNRIVLQDEYKPLHFTTTLKIKLRIILFYVKTYVSRILSFLTNICKKKSRKYFEIVHIINVLTIK